MRPKIREEARFIKSGGGTFQVKERACLVYDLYFSMAQAFAGRQVVPGEGGKGRRANHTSKTSKPSKRDWMTQKGSEQEIM